MADAPDENAYTNWKAVDGDKDEEIKEICRDKVS